MKGLEQSKLFYEQCKEKIRIKFPEIFLRMAMGLVGEGSECFGFDDEISVDHDFDKGFCIWLTEEDYERYGTKIQQLYFQLLSGEKTEINSAYGAERRGVLSVGQFYLQKTGGVKGPETVMDWLFVPEYSLAECVNGEVFTDPLGEFTKIRNQLLRGYPEEVRKKKIAARAAKMAQSGQYNYRRCLAHGEDGAARLALDGFVQHTIHMVYLLNNKYCPYYKWMFRGMEQLAILSEIKEELTALLCAPDTEENIQVKMAIIEQIAGRVIEELKRQGLSTEDGDYLESHGFSVMEKITDSDLKSLHIMAGI